MTYETAEKLKKAGFPQKQTFGGLYYPLPPFKRVIMMDVFLSYESKMREESVDCIIPTLSDLLEACGERFHELTRYDSNWSAVSCDGKIDERGFTAEEAVANLYLKLHEK